MTIKGNFRSREHFDMISSQQYVQEGRIWEYDQSIWGARHWRWQGNDHQQYFPLHLPCWHYYQPYYNHLSHHHHHPHQQPFRIIIILVYVGWALGLDKTFSGEQNYCIRWEFCTSKYWHKCQNLLKIRWLHGQLDMDQETPPPCKKEETKQKCGWQVFP